MQQRMHPGIQSETQSEMQPGSGKTEGKVEGMDGYSVDLSIDPDTTGSAALAYLGDSVYELLVRRFVLASGLVKTDEIHKKTTSLVNAAAQSELIHFIEESLTEEEQTVYRRARNTHTHSQAKNQKVHDYRRATGFEALIGWLYLKEKNDRIAELINPWLEKRIGPETDDKNQKTGNLQTAGDAQTAGNAQTAGEAQTTGNAQTPGNIQT